MFFWQIFAIIFEGNFRGNLRVHQIRISLRLFKPKLWINIRWTFRRILWKTSRWNFQQNLKKKSLGEFPWGILGGTLYGNFVANLWQKFLYLSSGNFSCNFQSDFWIFFLEKFPKKTKFWMNYRRNLLAISFRLKKIYRNSIQVVLHAF